MAPQPSRQADRRTLLRFPSLEAAARFRREAMTKGIRTAFPEGTTADLFPGRLLLWMLLGAVAGAIVGGVAGAVGEGLLAGLPRVEPLFAAPSGAVTLLALVTAACVGAVVPALVHLPRTRPRRYLNTGDLVVLGEPDAMALQAFLNRWHGTVASTGTPVRTAGPSSTPGPRTSPTRPTATSGGSRPTSTPRRRTARSRTSGFSARPARSGTTPRPAPTSRSRPTST